MPLADIQDSGQALLAASGLLQYEVSAYSRAGRQSRHNNNYWQFGDYLGIGAGAHGKVTDLRDGTLLRRWKTRQPSHYLDTDKTVLAGQQALLPSKLPLEFLMNALRLSAGVDSALYPQRTGLALAQIHSQWQQLQDDGLMTRDPQRLQTTALGQRFLNSVLERFLS